MTYKLLFIHQKVCVFKTDKVSSVVFPPNMGTNNIGVIYMIVNVIKLVDRIGRLRLVSLRSCQSLVHIVYYFRRWINSTYIHTYIHTFMVCQWTSLYLLFTVVNIVLKFHFRVIQTVWFHGFKFLDKVKSPISSGYTCVSVSSY